MVSESLLNFPPTATQAHQSAPSSIKRRACAKGGLTSRALNLLQVVKDKKLPIDSYCYTAVIDGTSATFFVRVGGVVDMLDWHLC